MADPLITSLVYSCGAMEMTQLTESSGSSPQNFRQEGDPLPALKALLSQHPLSGPCATALPAADVMLMVLNLPAILPAEIAGMVQLQAEEISPFPAERTCVAWECLAQQDQHSRVIMGLCARKPLDQIHDLFQSQCRVPDRVDVDVLGWLELLKSGGFLREATGVLLLILKGEHCDVVAWQNGAPCLLRSLVKVREMDADTLHEELMMVLLSLDGHFDQPAGLSLQIWHDGSPPLWVNDPPADWQFDLHRLDQLPPLSEGLARRSLLDNRLDLSPPAWRAEKIRLQNRKQHLRLGITLAGGWILLMIGFLGWSLIRQSGLQSLVKENQAAANDVTQVEALSERVRSLTQFTDRSSSALETLLILATAAPGSGSVVIEDYRYEKEEGIIFSGNISGDQQPFYQFLEDLSASEGLRVKSYDLKESRSGFSFQVEAVWSWIEAASDGDAE